MEPRINAFKVESMAAFRKPANLFSGGEFAETDGAFDTVVKLARLAKNDWD